MRDLDRAERGIDGRSTVRRHVTDPSTQRAPRPSCNQARNRSTPGSRTAIGQAGAPFATAADLIGLRAPAPERARVRHPIRIG
jgi:hypothetical protein